MSAAMTRELQRRAAEVDLCRFLAACYYEPGPEFVEERVFDSMREAARLIDPELEQSATRLSAAFSSEQIEDLLVEYARLFLGPADAPAKPYGSVWLGGPGALMQDSTLAVNRLYQEGGFELSGEFRDLPDHIAAELEFLYLLIFRSEAARQDGDADRMQEIAGIQRRLLGEHLGAWVEPFTQAMKHASRSPFYRELASMTERFVRAEASRLS